MKRLLGTITLLLLSLSVFAQSADSVAFVSARRQKFRIRNGAGYTLSTTLFGAAQTISVIKFSPEKFRLEVIQPEEHTEVSVVGEDSRAQFAINAGFWNRNMMPTTFIKSKGAVVSTTHLGLMPRINGVLFIYEHGIEIVESEDAPDYPSLAEKCNNCDNIIACGPLLVDNGKRMNYDHIINSQDESLRRKGVFYKRRHPRSAIGCDREGNIYFMVVDGRVKDRAEGMSIAELSQLCMWLGLYDAMNLDGGGSSALWSSKYGVINHPCDNRKFDHEGERKVSSVIVAKKK